MDTTKGSYQKLDDKSEDKSEKTTMDESKKLAVDLERVLKMFEDTGIEEYFNIKDFDKFYKSFVKVNGNSIDTFSVMNGCIGKFKKAVEELDKVCTKFTKPTLGKGLFSVSNIYLKRISKYAKSFCNDLSSIKTEVTSKDICEKNFNKFSKNLENLKCAVISTINSEIKTLNKPAKIQDKKVKSLMQGIASQINSFYNIYDGRYKNECFK